MLHFLIPSWSQTEVKDSFHILLSILNDVQPYWTVYTDSAMRLNAIKTLRMPAIMKMSPNLFFFVPKFKLNSVP